MRLDNAVAGDSYACDASHLRCIFAWTCYVAAKLRGWNVGHSA